MPLVNTTAEQLAQEALVREEEQRDDSAFQRRSYPSRELPIAIREYAPGNPVVIDGLVYKSEGLTLHWHLPPSDDGFQETQAIRWAWRCKGCGRADTSVQMPQHCDTCDDGESRATSTCSHRGSPSVSAPSRKMCWPSGSMCRPAIPGLLAGDLRRFPNPKPAVSATIPKATCSTTAMARNASASPFVCAAGGQSQRRAGRMGVPLRSRSMNACAVAARPITRISALAATARTPSSGTCRLGGQVLRAREPVRGPAARTGPAGRDAEAKLERGPGFPKVGPPMRGISTTGRCGTASLAKSATAGGKLSIVVALPKPVRNTFLLGHAAFAGEPG